MKWIIFIIPLLFLISSCYYDKEELLYPESVSTCDSVDVSYAQHVKPLLAIECYSCHSSSIASGGIIMGTYATDAALAANGKLYGTVSYSQGFIPMPSGKAMLTACNLGLIKKWIDKGAPNN